MNRHLDRLQTNFAALICNNKNLPALAPAFFAEDVLSTVAAPDFSPVTEPSPFDEFWIIYESSNGVLGTISNFALVQNRIVRLWGIVDGLSKTLDHFATFDLDNPTHYSLGLRCNPRAVRETIPEMRIMLDRINSHEREETTPNSLRRLNKARVKVGQKKLAPYIVLKPTRSVSAAVGTGQGSAKCPHNRRGHNRTLRSGRVIWIPDCKIRDGSPVARDYLLAKPKPKPMNVNVGPHSRIVNPEHQTDVADRVLVSVRAVQKNEVA